MSVEGARGGFDNIEPTELVVGKIYGLRAFRAYNKEELGSVVRDYPYEKGENLAKHSLEVSGYRASKEGHKVAGRGCSCGFYAFYTATDDVTSYNGDCYGVIESWGRVSVGNAGFRAEKAKIVALIPARKSELQSNKVDRWLANTNWAMAITVIVSLKIMLILLGIGFALKLNVISLWFMFATVPVQLAISWYVGNSIGKSLRNITVLRQQKVNRKQLQNFADYYEVPIINHFEEAIAKYGIGMRPPSH